MRTAKMPTPWRHQLQAERALTAARESGTSSALMVMATGLGKNYTAALAFERFRRSMQLLGKRCRLLFLAHQSHILDQARKTFELVFRRHMSYGTFNGVVKEWRAKAVFATFQSADSGLFGRARRKRRPFGRRGFDYVIVDESHHSHAPTYRRVIRYFLPRFMMGMTATPDRTDLQDIREIYGNEIYSLPLEEGLARGLLAPVDYRLVTDGLQDLSVLDTPIGRLSMKRLNKTLFIPRRDKEIVRIILKHMRRLQNPRIMIFCPSIQYSDRLERHLPDAVAIHSQLTSKEQAERLEQFRAGEYNIVLTVDKFNEGIDIPDANMIVFLRSTASRMIFLQQLGRGLRRIPGKKRVLVLDFAANCERLQMVNKLWSAVTDIQRPGAGRTKDVAVSVNIGTVKFSHVAQRILEVLHRIHQGYTKEVLVSQLRRLKRKLGRVPMQWDINKASKRGECASMSPFKTVFGSLAAAHRAAGMKPYYADTSRKALITQLKLLKRKLGGVPKKEDVEAASKRGECASAVPFRKVFGSFGSAIRAAGMMPHRVRHALEGKPSKPKLIAQLKRLHQKLGRVPTKQDINRASKRSECVNADWFGKTFGSLPAAHRAAGMLPYRLNVQFISLTKQLKQLRRKLGRIPTTPDVMAASKRRECSSLAVFTKRYGSFLKALRAAGMKPYHLDTSRKALIQQLKQLQQKLGRVPTGIDIRAASKRRECSSPSPFTVVFGSLAAAHRAAGMKPYHADITRGALITQLKRLQRKLGRVPTASDINAARKRRECAHSSTFASIFGSLAAAQHVAGMTPYHADTSPKALIAQLKLLERKLGRVPTYDDIVAASKRRECASYAVFPREFGSMHEAQLAAGMTPIRKRPRPRKTGHRRNK